MNTQSPPAAFDPYIAVADFDLSKNRGLSRSLEEWMSSKPYSDEQKEQIRIVYQKIGGSGASEN